MSLTNRTLVRGGSFEPESQSENNEESIVPVVHRRELGLVENASPEPSSNSPIANPGALEAVALEDGGQRTPHPASDLGSPRAWDETAFARRDAANGREAPLSWNATRHTTATSLRAPLGSLEGQRRDGVSNT